MNRRALLLSSLTALALPQEVLARLAQQDKKRVALVLANQDYQKNPLPNILNDANAMEAALKKIGFTVIKGTNLSRSGILGKLREFRTQIEETSGCIALVYYSGHGAAVGGENYLIPIQNEGFSRADDLPDECVSLGRVLESLGKSEGQLNLVILDACRDNPFPAASKSQGSKGLTVVGRNVAGTLIAFAASPGEVASANPDGTNSLFTQELVKVLPLPGLRLEDVFLRTRTAVRKQSGGAQIPQEYGSLESVVYLAGSSDFATGEGKLTVKNTVGRLVFVGLPAGAVVKVDGQRISGTEYEAELTGDTQDVSLEVSASGFRPLRGATTIERGKALRVPLMLEPTNGAGKGRLALAANKARSAGFPNLATYIEEFCEVPAGPFTMGSDSGRADEKPKRQVNLTGFYMGKTEVTVALWKEYAKARLGRKMPPEPHLNGKRFNLNWSKDDHPMVNLSWNDIMGEGGKGGFCVWASEVSGITITLPTEAQWEKAARGTDGREFPWQGDFDPAKLWGGESKLKELGGTQRVGQFPEGKSPYGCLDMAGNVWEWCLDSLDGDDQTSLSYGKKALRGSSWYIPNAFNFRCAFRNVSYPTERLFDFGFRLSSTGT